ncbi:MAG: methyltransferase domain-containing protein [Myxococcota bacterium]
MAILLWTLGIIVALIAIARVRSLVAPRAFPPWMTPLLETPGRDRGRILERAGVARGERVLEIGPGGGFITEKALERVGETGRLVCLDIQIEMLRKVRERLGDGAELVCASGSQLPFRDGAFQRAFLVSVLGEIPDKRRACAELFRVLGPAGELAIEEGIPDPDYIRTPVLRRLVEQAGFQTRERVGSWARYTQRFARP